MERARLRPILAGLLLALNACTAVPTPDLQPLDPVSISASAPAGLRLISETDYMSFVVPGSNHPSLMAWGVHGTPRTIFYPGEGIVAAQEVTWSEPTANAGSHNIEWRLYRGTDLLKQFRNDEHLVGKPALLRSHVSAGSFPPGRYRLELLLDQKPFSSAAFEILQGQSPAPLSATITGPNCDGTPKPTLKPIRPVLPVFPAVAMERKTAGCASVSIIIDDTGHPTGVRLDSEYPQGSGFGGSVVKAAWTAVFPPGHGGQTTYLKAHFEPAPDLRK